MAGAESGLEFPVSPFFIRALNKISYIQSQFKSSVGFELNLINPKTFCEKIQWLKLFNQDPLVTLCSDKVAVKNYVREKLGRDICIPTLKTFRSVADFNLAEMPPKFVLKLNNGSGAMLFYEGPHSFSEARIKELIEDWLGPTFSYYAQNYEWAYRYIQPTMLVEPLVPGLGKLDDYKFLCFHGEPKLLYVATRISGVLHVDYFDLEWNRLPYRRGSNAPIPYAVARPEKFAEMCAVARTLSADFSFVRVDLYYHEHQVLFGELTFYPGNGISPFKPDHVEDELGALLHLPEHALLFSEATGRAVEVPREALPALLDMAEPLSVSAGAKTGKVACYWEDKVTRMQTSFSWRVTSPLRFVKRTLRRLRPKA
ncbi:ATP-grasp fold amidoligase family protein [Rariglobus hedericola]